LARVIIEADRRSEGLGFSIWWMISPRAEVGHAMSKLALAAPLTVVIEM